MKPEVILTSLSLALGSFLTMPAIAEEKSADLTPAEAKSLAQEAWVFGMPNRKRAAQY